MADALVGATIQVLLEKSISLASERIGLIIGFKEELQSLRESAATIQAVLADAEDKQMHNHAVQLWLKELEGVAFDADNVLDEINYEVLRRKVESLNQLNGKVCFFFSFSNTKIAFRWRMASKVRDINMKLEKINKKANEYGLINRFQMAVSLPAATTGMTSSRQTDSLLSPNIVGRSNDESKIVEMLLSPSDEVVSVIPIIGMGGLGKTTLAKSVYNNHKIDEHFKTKIWVCVSENFEVMEVFKLMLESLTRRNVEIVSRDVVVQEIRKLLEEKRYLLVLDDVWNQIPNLWDDFLKTLVGFNSTNGSRCLVTTRLQQVASIVSRHGPYLLGKLSNDDCWLILKENAIAGGVVPKELNDIRDHIIKRCDGLPLAANVIGSLLRLQRKEDWQSIVESRLLNLSGGESGVEQILKVSFDYLPSASLKKCFAYCSIFAKDTRIERDLLIELWMAEGFLQSNVENERKMEKIGIKCCEILLQSSLLEEGSGWDGIYYTMHDLVYDLAQSISRSGSTNLENGVISNNYPVRYLALKSFGEETKKVIEGVSTSLRSLFLDSESGIACNMLSMFMNLHVLNLSIANLKELPTSIGKLKHLRFFNLSNNNIATLPESLCKLYNLQTLRIQYHQSLPKQMSNLISLRHLHYWNSNAKLQMPLEMGRLTCLQTLKFFNVGQEKGRRIEELGCLGDLSGSLDIRNLELVNGKEGAEGANLFGKPNLSELEFQWGWDRECDIYDDENVLEGLQPHPNLKKLQIKNYMGDHFPQWFMNLSTILNHLVDLSLTNCKRCKEIPALGQLPFLQNLDLSGPKNITCIEPSFYVTNGQVSSKLFPALKHLFLEDMENLVEWMEAVVTSRINNDEEAVVDVFPLLESLTIVNCSQLTTAPSHFPSLKELRIIKNDHVLLASKILSKVTTLESLKIDGMAGLTCVSDLGGPLHNNQSLKYLRLEGCPNLTTIRGCCSTSLQDLVIRNCENLKELQFPKGKYDLTSLHSLTISDCNRLSSLPGHLLESFTSLDSLKIHGCNGLISLPDYMLESTGTFLKSLRVCDCPNLVSFSLDFQKMPSLSCLELFRCPKLMMSDMPKGFGFLTRLRELRIGPLCSDGSSIEFDWSGLISLSTLRLLHLNGMPQLESLPDQLQHLTTLTSLHLWDFGGVEALPDWIGNLANLENLGLWNCEKLRYLPSVAAVRRLTRLNRLRIENFPLLKKRCSPQSGPDSEWSKIYHIPDLWI